jgi:hypothetical protein
MLVQSKVPQKSFFPFRKKELRAKSKKCRENFFAEQRAKRAAAGRSSQNSQFRFSSKKFGFRPTNTTKINYKNTILNEAKQSYASVLAECGTPH